MTRKLRYEIGGQRGIRPIHTLRVQQINLFAFGQLFPLVVLIFGRRRPIYLTLLFLTCWNEMKILISMLGAFFWITGAHRYSTRDV